MEEEKKEYTWKMIYSIELYIYYNLSLLFIKILWDFTFISRGLNFTRNFKGRVQEIWNTYLSYIL